MEEKRYLKHMNWDYDKCNEAYKCHDTDDEWINIDDEYSPIEIRFDKVEKNRRKEHHPYSHKDDKYNHIEDSNCQGCICDQLKKLEPGTLIDAFLSSGGTFTALSFLRLDPRNCCAYFIESEAANNPLIIDCRKIDAIRRNPC